MEGTTKVKYKIDHNSRTKNRTKKTYEHKNPFQNIAHLFGPKKMFSGCIDTFERPYQSQKLKIAMIGKFIFRSSQNITQLFGQNMKTALFEGEGGMGESACR